jgi:hypothetical protein
MAVSVIGPDADAPVDDDDPHAEAAMRTAAATSVMPALAVVELCRVRPAVLLFIRAHFYAETFR